VADQCSAARCVQQPVHRCLPRHFAIASLDQQISDLRNSVIGITVLAVVVGIIVRRVGLEDGS
jgi:hypothetical protein